MERPSPRHRTPLHPGAPRDALAQPGWPLAGWAPAARELALLVMLALAAGCGGERPDAAGGPAPAAAQPAVADAPALTLPHLGQGARVIASSTHLGGPGEGPPANLVDGDPDTCWSSAYADNQEILIDLATVHAVGRLRMMWTTAAAKSFSVQISPDGGTWSAPIATAHGRPGPRIEDVPIGAPARYIRIALTERATALGFALYEIMILER
jgi:hypothetical protein